MNTRVVQAATIIPAASRIDGAQCYARRVAKPPIGEEAEVAAFCAHVGGRIEPFDRGGENALSFNNTCLHLGFPIRRCSRELLVSSAFTKVTVDVWSL
jgi:hypothetical protein